MDKAESRRGKFNLPIWVAVIVVAVCIAAGVFIGNRANKSDDSVQPQTSTVAVEHSTSNQETSSTRPSVDRTQWNLILVNQWNPLPEIDGIELTKLNNGLFADSRCYPDLRQMMDDCRSEGLHPIICSAYRTQEKQESLFNKQVEKWKKQGYSDEEAKIQAGTLVAVPGTSEHQTGLAYDIVDEGYQILDENQENTDVQKWLMSNSWKYGFILRYPTDKSDITGISYEPWHYRYVGKEAAKEIYDAGICLEEYLDS